MVLYLAREVLSNLDSERKGLFKFGSSEQWPYEENWGENEDVMMMMMMKTIIKPQVN